MFKEWKQIFINFRKQTINSPCGLLDFCSTFPLAHSESNYRSITVLFCCSNPSFQHIPYYSHETLLHLLLLNLFIKSRAPSGTYRIEIFSKNHETYVTTGHCSILISGG